MAVVLRRSTQADRAHRPAGLPGVHKDASYKIMDAGIPSSRRVIRARKIRAMTDSTRYEASLASIMMSFVVLCALDLACVPLWAALPGCAVIVASMLASVIMFAGHNTPARHPSTSGKTTRRR